MPVFAFVNGDEQHCLRCTVCCRWPGVVLFPGEAVTDVAALLGMDERECAELFFELHEDRIHVQTKPTAHGGCIFLDDNGCRIYEMRPRQCRTFPYEWQRDDEPELMRECRLYRALFERAQAQLTPMAGR